MNIKQKVKTNYNKRVYFLESQFVEISIFYVLIYWNEDDDAKMYEARRYHLPKFVIKDYNIVINGKNFYVLGRNNCMCESAHTLCYGHVGSCAIFISFDLYVGELIHA